MQKETIPKAGQDNCRRSNTMTKDRKWLANHFKGSVHTGTYMMSHDKILPKPKQVFISINNYNLNNIFKT